MPGQPLAGLIVIAVEQALAAPWCTARVADAGARVINIERPDDDFARFYDDAALMAAAISSGSTGASKRNLGSASV